MDYTFVILKDAVKIDSYVDVASLYDIIDFKVAYDNTYVSTTNWNI